MLVAREQGIHRCLIDFRGMQTADAPIPKGKLNPIVVIGAESLRIVQFRMLRHVDILRLCPGNARSCCLSNHDGVGYPIREFVKRDSGCPSEGAMRTECSRVRRCCDRVGNGAGSRAGEERQRRKDRRPRDRRRSRCPGGADVKFGDPIQQFRIVRPVPRFGKIVRFVELNLIQKRQQQDAPTVHRSALFVGNVSGWKRPVRRFVIVQSQTDLFQIAIA